MPTREQYESLCVRAKLLEDDSKALVLRVEQQEKEKKRLQKIINTARQLFQNQEPNPTEDDTKQTQQSTQAAPVEITSEKPVAVVNQTTNNATEQASTAKIEERFSNGLKEAIFNFLTKHTNVWFQGMEIAIALGHEYDAAFREAYDALASLTAQGIEFSTQGLRRTKI